MEILGMDMAQNRRPPPTSPSWDHRIHKSTENNSSEEHPVLQQENCLYSDPISLGKGSVNM